MADHQEYLSLERNNAETDAFVKARNDETAAALFDCQYEDDKATISAILQDPDKPFYYRQRAGFWYDFHQDTANPKGIWRRVPADVIPNANSNWELVFNLDAYCASENHNWVWRGVETSPFDPLQVLLILSDDGSDRVRFVEFDCTTKAIIKDGFDIPAAKADAYWYSPDCLWICTSRGANNATSSGWARVAKLLKRGENLDQVPSVFEAETNDVALWSYVEQTPKGPPIVFCTRFLEIGKSLVLVGTDPENMATIDAPLEATVDIIGTHFAFSPDVEDTYEAGSLVLGEIDLGTGALRNKQTLFTPSDTKTLGNFFLTKDWLFWQAHENLKPQLFQINLHDADAKPQEIILPGGFDFVHFGTLNADIQSGDSRLLITLQGLIQPPETYEYNPASDQPMRLMKRTANRFNANGMRVELNYATSDDGTKIPYHIALPKGAINGETPVQIYGYGGYGASLYPFSYLGIIGKTWLEKGGAYVVAYIRGGAEFGPDWHRSVKRHNRHKCFEDFKSVAQDIAKRGISTPSRIACQGGSNGGLLTGVMLTRYPEYFGAIVSEVPVLDMTRFHLFAAGMAWIDEYGDPENAVDREYLLGYSPFHQIQAATNTPYPPALFSTHHSDDRVDPSHARRMVAKLRDAGHKPLFYQSKTGGHSGGGDLDSTASDKAIVTSFLRHTIGKNILD